MTRSLQKIGDLRALRRTVPGVFRRISFEWYLALPGEHFSTLLYVDTSALHYRRACDHERRDTDAMRIGRLVHAMVLTGATPGDVAVYGGKVRHGKAWDEFEASNANKFIVRRADLDGAEAMRAAVMAHPVARELLSEGEGEVSIRWRDEATGLLCKARIDWLGARQVELKTTRKIHPRLFQAEFARRLYHAQLAFYSGGLEAVGMARSLPPAVIVVENQPPYDVCVYTALHDTIEPGSRKVGEWLRTVAACRESGRWPGVSSAAMPMMLPAWSITDGMVDPDMSSLEEALDGEA